MKEPAKPITAAAALALWDAGEQLYSIELIGGLGPSYEQATQIAVFEIIRAYAGRLDRVPEPLFGAGGDWADEVLDAIAEDLPLEGGQWALARHFAQMVLRRGWHATLDLAPPDRLIAVSTWWPRVPAAAAS